MVIIWGVATAPPFMSMRIASGFCRLAEPHTEMKALFERQRGPRVPFLVVNNNIAHARRVLAPVVVPLEVVLQSDVLADGLVPAEQIDGFGGFRDIKLFGLKDDAVHGNIQLLSAVRHTRLEHLGSSRSLEKVIKVFAAHIGDVRFHSLREDPHVGSSAHFAHTTLHAKVANLHSVGRLLYAGPVFELLRHNAADLRLKFLRKNSIKRRGGDHEVSTRFRTLLRMQSEG